MLIQRFRLKSDADVSCIPEDPYMTYVHRDAVRGMYRILYDSIEVSIAFPVDLSQWNDFDFVIVLDDNFGQPFTPFYHYMDGEIELYPFLENVVNAYNDFMNAQPYLERVE